MGAVLSDGAKPHCKVYDTTVRRRTRRQSNGNERSGVNWGDYEVLCEVRARAERDVGSDA